MPLIKINRQRILTLVLFLLIVLVIPNLMIGKRSGDDESGIGGGPPEGISGLEGQRVVIESIPVLEIINPNIFRIGSEADSVLVILDTNPKNQLIPEGSSPAEKGDNVQLIGTMKMLPSMEDVRIAWDITRETAGMLEGETVYLEAEELHLTSTESL